MKKVLLLAALCMLGVLMFASVALAVNKVCTNKPCYGTNDRDVLFERPGEGLGDRIYGKRSGDRIDATRYFRDNDFLYGNRGNDTLNAYDDGFDVDAVYGGAGYDTCYINSVDSSSGCEVLYIEGVLQ